MSENTKIEWCDHTFNPWEGCQEAGPGCDRCYAKARNSRYNHGVAVNWGPGAPRRRTSEANWRKPLQWNANACWFVQCNDCGWRGVSKGATCGGCHGCDTSPARPRVFCASLADVFDNAVDPQWRADLFALITKTPHLDWLLLTKRIGNVHGMLAELAHGSDPDLSLLDMMPLPNVWIGATIVNREEVLRDGPKLKQVPAHVHFWSCEPLLSDLGEIPGELMPHWIIAGGESGPGARPMHPDWARSLRDQCQAAGVPFLFKQWGEWAEAGASPWHAYAISPNGAKRPCEGTRAMAEALMEKVGKKAAGRLLDGRTWDGFPAPTALPPLQPGVTMFHGSPDCRGHAHPLSGRTEIEG